MWKKLKSRGAETVEYAIVLACIAAFGLMFSDNLTHTLETLMGKTGSIITNGSTNNGNQEDNDDNNNQEDEKDKLNQKINDKNMAWLEGTFLNAMTNEKNADRIKNYIGTYSEQKKEPDFKKTNGLIDSDSNSQFLKDIGLLNAGGLKDSSWAFAGYKNEYGDLCYGVSIYNKEKNKGQSLADKGKGDKITTDIYTVNTKTNEVTLIKQNVQTQYVGKNDNGTANVIRGDYK